MKHVTLTHAQKELFNRRQDLQREYVDLGFRIAKNHMDQNDERYLELTKKQDVVSKLLESTPSIVALVEVGWRHADGKYDDAYTERYARSCNDPIASAVAQWAIDHAFAVKAYGGERIETRVIEVYEQANDR